MRRRERFSLLLLDEGEVLLDDIAVECDHGADAHGVRRTPLDGRLKIASRSLVFDPQDWRHPIARIPLGDVTVVELEASPLLRRNRKASSDASWRRVDSAVYASATLVVQTRAGFVAQKKNGDSHEYYRVEGPSARRMGFFPLFCDVEHLFALVERLRAALGGGAGEELLRRLLLEKGLERASHFDISKFELSLSGSETRGPPPLLLDMPATVVQPLVQTVGRLRLSRTALYFTPVHGDESAAQKYLIHEMVSARAMFYGKRDRALEISFVAKDECDLHASTPSSVFVALDDHTSRDSAFLAIESLMSHNPATLDLSEATGQWQQGVIGNFEYLRILNAAAGRSFNDLSQYPVYPWVLSDYESDALDLSDPNIYRDLSKPVAALNPERLAMFHERYSRLPDDEPHFLFGTHYSCPAYVLFFLVRAAPDAMLRLQGGRFDSPDRTFFSVGAAWRSATTHSGDVRELIPEFFAIDESELLPESCVRQQNESYMLGDFLANSLGLNLGQRQNGQWINDVELPPWADGSIENFMRLNRAALESDYVSDNLHLWIDLIFGVKSRSFNDNNLFYTDVVDLNDLEIGSRGDLLLQEFGRTPRRLFGHPHSRRRVSTTFPAIHTGQADPPEVSKENFQRSCRVYHNGTHLVACAASAHLVATVSKEGLLQVHDSLNTDKAKRSGRLANELNCVVLGQDEVVFCSGPDGRILLYDLSSGRTIEASRIAHTESVEALDFSLLRVGSKDRWFLASAGSDAVRGWIQSGAYEMRLACDLDAEGPVRDVVVWTRGTEASICTLRVDNSVLVWFDIELEKGDNPFKDPSWSWSPSAVGGDRDNNLLGRPRISWVTRDSLAFISGERLLLQTFPENRQRLDSLEGPVEIAVDKPTCIVKTNDGFVVGCNDGSIWKCRPTGKRFGLVGKEESPVVALASDGSLVHCLVAGSPSSLISYKCASYG